MNNIRLTKDPWRFLRKYHKPLFLLILLGIYGIVGIYDVLNERPQSIHMIAQTDRASVALNYYEENMNFFKPRIHNIDNETGRVGLEFPLMNYLAALCYQLFGFNEIFYRLLMLAVATFGIMAAYLLANNFLNNPIWAGAITLTWASSPLLHYYAPNFLSGMASLAFMMAGWWCFLQNASNRKWTWLFFLFITLAGLTKISSGIGIIAMLILVLAKMIWPKTGSKLGDKIPANRNILLAIFGSVFIIAAWYLYSNHLKQFYGSGYFLMHIKPVTDWTTFKDVAKTFVALWIEAIYAPVTWLILAIAGLTIFKFRKNLDWGLGAITGLLILGSAGFCYLMFFQLKHHDYYLLPLMPLPFFLLLTAGDAFLANMKAHNPSGYITKGVPLILGILLIPALIHSKGEQQYRYNKVGFQQFGINYKPYTTLENELNKQGIKRDDHIISFKDNSPNITLYLMNRKGFTFWTKFAPARIPYRIYQQGDYLIINDTSFTNFPSVQYFIDTPEWTHKDLKIYDINLTSDQRKAFLDSILNTLKPLIQNHWNWKAYEEKVQKYHEHFGLSLKEARAKKAYATYRWILNNFVRPKLHQQFPEKIRSNANHIEIARFYKAHQDECEALYKADVFNKHQWLVLKSPLPWLFYQYTPE